MKDLGTLSYFLGLEVTSSSDGYYLSQAKYAFDLLSKAGITDNKIASTPLEYNAKLTPLDGEPISDTTHYRQLVGSLIYLIVTYSDISRAMGMVSKFMDASFYSLCCYSLDSPICQRHTLSWSPLLLSIFSRTSCLFKCGLGR